MDKLKFILVFIILTSWWSSQLVIASHHRHQPSIWPYPHSLISTSTEHYLLNAQAFTILPANDDSHASCDLLSRAISRHRERLFIQNCSLINKSQDLKPFSIAQPQLNSTGLNGILSNLTVTYKGACEKWPSLEMVESYRLSISGGVARIEGDSVWGAIRGLETFSQLVIMVGVDEFAVEAVVIEDGPRFKHRGLLVDTSRHFIPLHLIYQTLDAMEMNKLNVFHWHIVDDQSFPYVSETFPELSEKGAYSPSFVYSKADVDDVLEYARLRGIRLLVEFDSPGHTESWGAGRPGLLTACYNESTGEPEPGAFGPIDPTASSTFEFLQSLFAEISQRFPEHYIHLGGDEVSFTSKCWTTNPGTAAFMEGRGWSKNDTTKLETYYVEKVVGIVQGLNRSSIVWQDVFDNNATLAPDTVVQVWKPWGNGNDSWQEELASVTSKGHKVIFSTPWYLDLVRHGDDWRNFYEVDPQNFTGTAEQKNLVIGGEAALWSEYINGANLIAFTWPRTSATAERLWSPAAASGRTGSSSEAAKRRFRDNSCRMQMRGLRVGPGEGPGWCPCDGVL